MRKSRPQHFTHKIGLERLCGNIPVAASWPLASHENLGLAPSDPFQLLRLFSSVPVWIRRAFRYPLGRSVGGVAAP